LSDAKYEYAKMQGKILLKDALAFTVFLLIFVCYVAGRPTAKYLTYLLTLRYVLEFDNLHTTQCAKIIVGFMENVGNVFIKSLQIFFLNFFPRFFTFFLKFLSERLLHLRLIRHA